MSYKIIYQSQLCRTQKTATIHPHICRQCPFCVRMCMLYYTESQAPVFKHAMRFESCIHKKNAYCINRIKTALVRCSSLLKCNTFTLYNFMNKRCAHVWCVCIYLRALLILLIVVAVIFLFFQFEITAKS